VNKKRKRETKAGTDHIYRGWDTAPSIYLWSVPDFAGIPRDPDAPKRVDPGQPGYSLELPKVWESLLEKKLE
jgi:hypothetical protein